MIVAARVILGIGVGLEGGTVPVYVAETVERRIRGNMVSLYQFNIALGEVFGYVVAAIFLHVEGNWRYILGSSLVFSTTMLVGYSLPSLLPSCLFQHTLWCLPFPPYAGLLNTWPIANAHMFHLACCSCQRAPAS
jgi:MFS family permease